MDAARKARNDSQSRPVLAGDKRYHMTKDAPPQRETELYTPVRDYLLTQGYAVRCEVHGCDIMASREDELIVIELKRAFSTALLVQATQRQRAADSVYVALPEPRSWKRSAHWRHVQHLLRRLELGLIWVAFGREEPRVEVVFHPLPFEREQQEHRRRAILREMAGRSGEYNQGGSYRRQIMTAYRENALLIACCLERHGQLSPRELRALGTGDKTQSILAHNYYEWFERVARGVYVLKPAGREALIAHPELVERLRARLDKAQR